VLSCITIILILLAFIPIAFAWGLFFGKKQGFLKGKKQGIEESNKRISQYL
jgi:hypothetical protein